MSTSTNKPIRQRHSAANPNKTTAIQKVNKLALKKKAKTTLPMVQFKSTEETRQNVLEVTVDLGRMFIAHVAHELGYLPGPRFDPNGLLTNKTATKLSDIAASFLVEEFLDTALDWMERDVVNQVREQEGLDPIS
jgi:hypothetical protein